MNTLRTRLAGLTATLAILLIAVGTPIVLLAIDAVPGPSDVTWDRLTAPDDGTLALVIISAVAWVAWAVMLVSLIAELVARVRGVRTVRLPGLAMPQLAAGRLVAVAALLFISTPVASESVSLPAAATLPVQPVAAVATAAQPPSAPLATTHTATPEPRPTIPYTVKRGDSLWRIAQEHLGGGTRFREIVALNEQALNGQPDFIAPGLVLRLPDERPESDPGDAYIVQRGDTLSEIAEAQLGEADRYPEIFDASRATVQPDGDRITDPDLIRPGWRLTLPIEDHTHRGARTKQDESDSERPPEVAEPPEITHADSSADSAGNEMAVQPSSDEDLPGWVLPGLAGAGAVLAGSLLLVLRQHRRTQLRYRRPGHVIVPPPSELTPTEKSVQASGSITAPRIEVLDRALRQLGESTPGTRVVTATLGSAEVVVKLATPAELPGPWSGTGTSWRIALTDVPAGQLGSGAPYPLLVSIGIDADGALVLINLEEVHAATIAGDPLKTAPLGRHIAAELALNPWSSLAEVDTVGIGAELAEIDPSRLHHHAGDDTAFLDQLAVDLESEDPSMEPDQFRTLITLSDVDSVQKVAKIIAGYEGRSGAAVLAIGAEAVVGDVALQVNATGQLTVDSLGLHLTAAGLSVDEARACATLVDITRDATISPVPADESSAVADATGALQEELTEPRPAEGPAGERSLLPMEEAVYEARAATVTEDVRRLAPVVTPETEKQVADADPQLDEDVARWQASRLMEPKLTLLGPVSARTLGDSRKMAHRRPFYIELLAFLTLHPKGVTANEIGEAFGIQADRARKDVGIIRGWLGPDPRTGKPHLPNARQTHAGGVMGKYVVRGVATDLDLFRRLRTRGESRGTAGIEDLTTALALVSGEPFTDLRPAGWSWLLDGERLDHIMTCAIVDTAHIVTSHALSIGDLDLARFAAETAADAAPYEEIPKLDLVAVDEAAGEDDRAGERLTHEVLNRSDDDVGPIGVPERSTTVLHQRGWTHHRSHSADM